MRGKNKSFLQNVKGFHEQTPKPFTIVNIMVTHQLVVSEQTVHIGAHIFWMECFLNVYFFATRLNQNQCVYGLANVKNHEMLIPIGFQT